MVTYVAKVGAWEAALAAMALKATAPTCDSPMAGATRGLVDPEGLSPVSPLARTLDSSGGGDAGAGAVRPMRCRIGTARRLTSYAGHGLTSVAMV